MGAPVEPVDSPEGITPSWLTGVLQAAGHDCEIRGLRRRQIGTGQIGASFRLELDLAAPSGSEVPPTLVAKLAAGSLPARERVKQGFQKEVRFYRDLRALTAVRAPRCWYAEQSTDLLTFTLLLEDLAPQVPGRQASGCRTDQAAAAVRNLAALHAPLWCAPVLAAHADWLAPMDAATGAFLGDLLMSATTEFVDLYRDRLSEQDSQTLHDCAASISRWAAIPADVFSVVHGDYRLDNLMFAPEGSDVTAIDWQTTTSGPPARDLAYFLSTSLLVDQRRQSERELVALYCEALAARRVEYPALQAWSDYRLGMLQGPLITVLGRIYATADPSPEADEMFLAMATRSCAAIRDLDVCAAVGNA